MGKSPQHYWSRVKLEMTNWSKKNIGRALQKLIKREIPISNVVRAIINFFISKILRFHLNSRPLVLFSNVFWSSAILESNAILLFFLVCNTELSCNIWQIYIFLGVFCKTHKVEKHFNILSSACPHKANHLKNWASDKERFGLFIYFL